MRKTIYTLLLPLLSCTAFAQDLIYINSGNVASGFDISKFDSLAFTANGTKGIIHAFGNITEVSLADIEYISFDEKATAVSVVYSGDAAKVINPFAGNGVSVTVSGADVIVNSESSDEIEYILSGKSSDGSFKLYSSKKYKLNFNGVSLEKTKGAPVNIQSGKKGTIILSDNTVNTLVDSEKYETVSGEDMKAAFFSEGQLIFSGDGTLNITGNCRHALCSDDYIEVESGNIVIKSAVTDGIHANDYVKIKGGNLDITASSDGIDAGDGFYNQSGGTVKINIPSDDVKGIKCDSIMTISDGEINMTVSGNQSKGLKSKQNMFITGGKIDIKCTGGVVVTSGDPSYCGAIKSDADIQISGADITINHTGAAGKGISADGDLSIYSGTVNITTTGNGSTYTNTSNTTDSYSATCIKSDGKINILGGTVTTSSSGSAGKGIVSDGDMTLGSSTTKPVVTAKTTGAKFSVSSSTTGGNNNRPGGGGWPGGGQTSGSYANPKAIKSKANLTVNSGIYTLSTTQDGGEGLESKATLTINGGTIEANCYDDCINASTSIVINGGEIYCYSSGNDGIDSNGTITITGGVIVTSGTSAPEDGIDCDNNTFKITGGVLIATGGSTSTPTSSVCTQYSVKYVSSASANQVLYIRDAAGTDILTYKIPRTYSSMTMLFSSPLIQAGTKYTIYKGGTITGGTSFHNYYTGATASGGTASKTFTPSTSNKVSTAN